MSIRLISADNNLLFDAIEQRLTYLENYTFNTTTASEPAFVSIDYNANTSEYILADTSNSSITITLPSNPNPLDTITIMDETNSFSSNPVFLDPGTNNLNAVNSVTPLTTPGVFQLIYTGDTNGWVISTGDEDNIWLYLNSDFYIPDSISNLNIYANTLSSPFTIYFPTTPSINTTITIIDAASTFDINKCTIDCSGINVIDSNNTIVDLDFKSLSITFIYNGTQWSILNMSKPYN